MPWRNDKEEEMKTREVAAHTNYLALTKARACACKLVESYKVDLLNDL